MPKQEPYALSAQNNKAHNYLYSAGKAGTRTGERGHTRSTARVAEIPRNDNTVIIYEITI